MTDDEVVAAALACVGARFRLHGRRVAQGLDCVGVAAHAFGIEAVPTGYALRGGAADAIVAVVRRLGFKACADAGPARLLLLDAGPFQFHLAVTTARGFVHADAGLRRVVERPGVPRWPVLGIWRKEA